MSIKEIYQFVIGLLFSVCVQAQQILPNTISCTKGSDPHPISYCEDATPCKVINGADVCLSNASNPPLGAYITNSTCWSMTTDYTCLQYVNTCARYTSDSQCTEIGSKACTNGADGQLMLSTNTKLGGCSSYTRHFSCIDPRKAADASYTTTTQCDVTGLQNGLEWKTTTGSSANDFVSAATAQEFSRQTATYATKDSTGVTNLFPGQPMDCRTGYFGLKNCCSSSGGGAVSNRTLASTAGQAAAMAVASHVVGYAVKVGSIYVYDTILANAPQYMSEGASTVLNAGMNNAAAGGFGAMGFGTTAGSAAGTFAAESGSIAFSAGDTVLFFNPAAFAIAIVIILVMEAMSCTQDEKDLQNARSENLCHSIGDYCSQSWGGCVEEKQSYCCYNGLLAKAIEESAHEQLNLSWGTPESPKCEGLTPAQLTSLNFNSPSMTAFMEPFRQSVMKGYQNTMAGQLSDGSVTNSMSTAATERSKSLCLQRQKLEPKTVCN